MYFTADLQMVKAGCGGMSLARLLRDVNHPADAEAIGNHAETRREERFGEGHAHLAAVSKGLEKAISVGRAGQVERKGKTLKVGLARAVAVGRHDGRVA